MKFLFLVGSAIKHFLEKDFSSFSEEERFNQTLKSIESIREKNPDSYIVIFECSFTEIKKEHKEILTEKCDLLLEFYNDPVMKTLYENIGNNPRYLPFGKSLLETRCLLNTLNHIKKEKLFQDINRVFKITGRYTLNEYFNINDYKSSFLHKKYVLKKVDYSKTDEIDSENIYASLYQLKGMIVTGLWSFDILLFDEIMNVLENSFDYMQKMIIYTSGVDIEHSLYKFLNKENIIFTSNLGLTVLKGFDGVSYKL